MKAFLFTTVLMVIGQTMGQSSGFDHALWDSLLHRYVHEGRVDYAGLAMQKAKLEKYLARVANLPESKYQRWSENEKLAFWINVYNAITVKAVLQHYPIQKGGFLARIRFPQNSIRQIPGFWDRVYTPVMGKALTLNQIEHEILRKQFREPRIHFAIVCASLGCPKLADRAYRGEQLNEQLDKAVREFIADPGKVFLDKSANILYLSPIFKWYREDFPTESTQKIAFYPPKWQGVMNFLLSYFPDADRMFVQENHPALKFLKYDWSLNEKREKSGN